VVKELSTLELRTRSDQKKKKTIVNKAQNNISFLSLHDKKYNNQKKKTTPKKITNHFFLL